ncbi:flagellar M-ring protein FliF [Sulfuritortus calidifontis]|uniref:Flagellar M-ring protein n=1 Tax=Sulfuritortus calidifontis TaxID=1914471 RepID=A0A4R3K0E2_9PROT|nr:flagellar basal-body MS-ring/collar protein FliF [Sulfuritortus calidifontis]TCS73911.1 flagellar M-ring protein FliF [Sulfuritortus calidifontis]
MAATPEQSFSNIVQRFNELPNTRKFAILVSLAAAIALVVGLFMWARTPDYRVLFSNLSERDGGAVVTALQQMNIPYKMAEGSGAILVPAEQVYDLRFRLASQGLPRGGAVGFELMDNAKLGMTQFQEQVTYQRALEGELSRTIQSLSPVESARVHLAIPKPSVFIRDKQAPSASVLVSLYPGRVLDVAQVNAIVHMVSSSVPELGADSVTVVDQAGRLLTAKNDSNSLKGLNANQLDYLREIEAYYAKRVEAIVSPIVGEGNVRAEVRADLDFSEAESTSESYKPNPTPDQQAVRSRQSVQSINGDGGQAAGIPGALTNQPPGPAAAPLTAQPGANAGTATGQGQANAGSRREENTINFEVDRTIRHVKEPLGRVKRLSVAVVVNYRQQAGQAAKPLAPEEMQQVTNLVREAMGFSQERGDTVNVVNAAFTETKVEPVDIPLWKDPSNVAFAKEALKNLLVIGLAFYLVFGVLRPLLKDWMKATAKKPAAEAPEEEMDLLAAFDAKLAQRELAGYDAHIASVREFAKQNPKAAADIIREWMAKE